MTTLLIGFPNKKSFGACRKMLKLWRAWCHPQGTCVVHQLAVMMRLVRLVGHHIKKKKIQRGGKGS